MARRIPFSSLVWCGAVSFALASACGGNSFSRGDGGSGAEGASGGSGSGGKQGQAGSIGAAGKPTAGSSTGGSASAGMGTGGAEAGSSSAGTGTGGAGDPACTAAPESGPCQALFTRWYHDPATGLCRPFPYGGCGGNSNNYETYANCQKSCQGGMPNFDACGVASDCEIGSTGCCGICDGPGLMASDFIVYNERNRDQVYERCQLIDIACQPCAVPGPYEESLKYFVPVCLAGECAIQDIRNSPLTACADSSECKLRYGTGCCEGCGDGGLVALSKNAQLESLVCGPELIGCPECEPSYPPDAAAVCNQGRCEVAYVAEL